MRGRAGSSTRRDRRSLSVAITAAISARSSLHGRRRHAGRRRTDGRERRAQVVRHGAKQRGLHHVAAAQRACLHHLLLEAAAARRRRSPAPGEGRQATRRSTRSRWASSGDSSRARAAWPPGPRVHQGDAARALLSPSSRSMRGSARSMPTAAAIRRPASSSPSSASTRPAPGAPARPPDRPRGGAPRPPRSARGPSPARVLVTTRRGEVDDQRHPVVVAGDREPAGGRDVEEVECRGAGKRGDHAQPDAPPGGHQQHREQVQHAGGQRRHRPVATGRSRP